MKISNITDVTCGVTQHQQSTKTNMEDRLYNRIKEFTHTHIIHRKYTIFDIFTTHRIIITTRVIPKRYTSINEEIPRVCIKTPVKCIWSVTFTCMYILILNYFKMYLNIHLKKKWKYIIFKEKIFDWFDRSDWQLNEETSVLLMKFNNS